MLKVSLVLVATLFIQVYSWKSCSNIECFLQETFENCDAYDECMTTGEDSYNTVMEYYSRAYRIQEAVQQDIDGPELDVLESAFHKQVDAGLRRCRYHKNVPSSLTCQSRWPSFYYFKYHYGDKEINMQEECQEFQESLQNACEIARENIITMRSCNIKEAFEEQVVKPWKDCLTLDNV